jgi:hypothetical protein
MSKKYTITLVVDDYLDKYCDKFTLEHYFRDLIYPVTNALDLIVRSIDVKGKR